MDFKREYARLNSAQRRAVDLIDGPVIVIAGPGTGKTQLLSMRAANILNLTDSLPDNILCLTFTEAASENMRSRLLSLVGKAANQIGIYTFHGFGTHIIQNYPEFFYDAPLIAQLNELGEYDLIEQLISKLHHDNPLTRRVSNSYLHLPSIIRAISLFKQAGLNATDLKLETTRNQSLFKAANKVLSEPFQSTPSPKMIGSYRNLLTSLREINNKLPSQLGETAADELEAAISLIDTSSKYAQTITRWRSKWLTQVQKGHWRFADQQKNIFLGHLAELYDQYQSKLFSDGLYTFDDMILRTTQAIELNNELKFNLQEKYQYILVDEYQDTNGAQDKILKQLSDNPVNEGRPNLMVVGDDDQAIYRFQGANSSVMKDFIKAWQPEQIVLTEGYRSGQNLLDLARGVILNAVDRLENTNPELTKVLTSAGAIKTTRISEVHSITETDGYINTANAIKKLIDDGQIPPSIAVLAPKHRYLENLVPYLLSAGIPVSYERREQILEQPRIVDILNLVELISSASRFKANQIETILPKVLAAEYWHLSPGDVWSLAIKAQKDHKGWLTALEEGEDKNLRYFAEAIKVLAKDALSQPFDLMLAYLMGNKTIKLSDGSLWDLPWRRYYFSEEQLKANPSDYINFMSQLEILRRAFKEWQPNDIRLRTVEDFNRFMELNKKAEFKMSSSNPYSSASEAVNLMTVFKAKGLEWDNVFVLNTEEDVWGTRTRSRKPSFSLPSTLKWIEPAMDNSSDLIRLFYVGLTRTRANLVLTSYDTKDSGIAAERLTWLDGLLPQPKPTKSPPASVIVSAYQHDWQEIYKSPTEDLRVLLEPILNTYKLSSTHLIDFLAVNRGGPRSFLYKHLLQVPEELSPSALYGDSIHKTLEFIHKQINSGKEMPDRSTIDSYFLSKLSNQPFSREELRFFKKRGKDELFGWLKSGNSHFEPSDMSERDFSNEQIVVGKAKLTGKIDVIKPTENGLVVVDYKTSSPIPGWSGLKASSAIKANNYQKQLLFYKLLVEHSPFMRNKPVVSGGIIEFVSPDQEDNYVSLAFEFVDSEIKRLEKIISIVWDKIINLDLPETEKYSPTIKGIKEFENDLLDGNI